MLMTATHCFPAGSRTDVWGFVVYLFFEGREQEGRSERMWSDMAP